MLKNLPFNFKIIAKKDYARAGEIFTPHGLVKTPTFMPVGTQASVKSLSVDDLKDCGAEIILGGNTYHMYLRPGMPVLQKNRGMHKFMQWDRAMLTDSGGFQVFSLGKKVENKGVWFKSHLDGSQHFMTPEKSIQIQKILGADIIMAFDQCIGDNQGKAKVLQAVKRTHSWLDRSIKVWQENDYCSPITGLYQALFGIIQGGLYKDLRRLSAEFVVSKNLPGIAIGGETIGFNMEKTTEVLDWIRDILPNNKLFYTMGLPQKPQDVVEAVFSGVDLFDCVAPTRMARNGALYQGTLKTRGKVSFASSYKNGYLNIANAIFKNDQNVIDKNCSCWVCRKGYTRSYLRHLFKSGELLYYRVASIHNVYFMLEICRQLRKFIVKK